MRDPSAWISGGLVGALGVVLGGVHLVHGIRELSAQLPAVLSGVVIPLLVSLLLVAGGYSIARRDWPDGVRWRAVAWCGGGLVVGVAASVLLVQYQAAEGTVLSDPLFVLAMFGTYGAALGLVIGQYDIETRTRQLEQERKTERLDEFASVVSHDLRNPLNVARGRLELARETDVDEEREHLDAVRRAHGRMEALIDDLLALAREGEEVTDPAAVDPGEVVRSCWQTVDTGEATLVTDLECTLLADESQLKQLFENLVRNAVEHGGSAVTVTVGELDDGFYVEDDGPGVPPEDRDRMLEPGYSTSSEGTGFGLSIVRRVVDAHGWELEVTRGQDGGARFEITGVDVAG